MSRISMAQADTIIKTAIATAREANLKPMAVAVLDPGGHLIAFAREDGTSILRPQIAQGKAFGALAVGRGTRWLDAQLANRPHFLEGLSNVSAGKIIPVPGGVIALDDVGEIVGAVGITGDTSDNDEICAVAGIEAVGFTTDTGA